MKTVKNLEIKFIGYNKNEGYVLDTFTDIAKETVDKLTTDYQYGRLKEGTQFFEMGDKTLVIDVNIRKDEITVLEII